MPPQLRTECAGQRLAGECSDSGPPLGRSGRRSDDREHCLRRQPGTTVAATLPATPAAAAVTATVSPRPQWRPTAAYDECKTLAGAATDEADTDPTCVQYLSFAL